MSVENGTRRGPAETTPGRSLGFWVLIAVLALSGVAMALIVLFGLAESRAFSMTGLILLADVYLIASLAARHNWLRWTIWGGAAISFGLGMVVTFWPGDPSYYEAWSTSYDSSEQWVRTAYGVASDASAALHAVVVILILLGFVSLGHRFLRENRILHAVYWFTFVAGLAAALLWAFDTVVRAPVDLVPVQLGVSILALTAAAIVTIGAFVQRKALYGRQEAQERERRRTAETTVLERAAPGLADDREELRALVRQYVEEYLRERGR